jgi:hypothetical protein
MDNKLVSINQQTDNSITLVKQSNVTLMKVNGQESVVLLENNQLIVKPLQTAALIQSSKETLKIKPQPRQTTYTKDDPVVNIIIGGLLFLICFVVVCLFMPKERLPFEVVTCKPTWFLMFQTGETCQTTKGFK